MEISQDSSYRFADDLGCGKTSIANRMRRCFLLPKVCKFWGRSEDALELMGQRRFFTRGG